MTDNQQIALAIVQTAPPTLAALAGILVNSRRAEALHRKMNTQFGAQGVAGLFGEVHREFELTRQVVAERLPHFDEVIER